MHFVSDNTAGAPTQILDAIVRANSGIDKSYGADRISARLTGKFSELFETQVVAFPVATGTAANALSLATLTPPHGAIFCHEGAHINVDECGAPEFYSGAKLVTVASPDGKVSPANLAPALGHFQRGVVHHVQPTTISIAQSTELGTVYTPADVKALGDFAKREGLALHMDGARFANAVAHLGCAPADVTWRAGVDVMSFGATKNGAIAAEAVIFFNQGLIRDFGYRSKRGGHLVSKARFVSAQLEAMIDDGLWLKLAAHANAMALRLEAGLRRISGVELTQPVEANEVFFTLPDQSKRKSLERQGATFYLWSPAKDPVPLIRLVCSFATREQDVDDFLAAVKTCFEAVIAAPGTARP
ncbi:MAG: low specificity L-threonine aldolase [Micropepsaceae bacterium]